MRLVRHGIIDEDLKDSVALVAFSGSHDYARVNMSSYADIVALAKNVVDTIADGVDRLQELGVQKVLVNSLPPLGCRPWWSRSNNYTACYGPQDVVTSVHNVYLKQKLGESDTILLLDLNTIFINIIVSQGSSPFKHRFTPCCDSFDPVGYCGQEDEDGDVQYSVCSVPDQSFYWDYMHPTQAGWKAVMEQLEEPIKGFLDI
ncbi:GDSL esterase/lipase At5g03610-like [Phragmites australis]|uniref:GDSL esterase/lipase At5g03610-like n=1 Tax=Phragmites australis TaxID=29695 RepID=UPI002D78186F|nr:GDSL esterase/lipase At5g03610-like [Phragmites australis]